MCEKFRTPRIFIIDYCDELINQIDIYTEKLLEQFAEADVLPCEPSPVKKREYLTGEDLDEICGEKYHPDIYLDGYNYEHIERPNVEPNVTKVHDYINQVRAKQIDEIRKVRDQNLETYEMNKLAYKIDRDKLTNQKLEKLKSRLFGHKFCFLLQVDNNQNNNSFPKQSVYNLYTVITDFYLSQLDINILRFSKSSWIPKLSGEKSLLFYLTCEYIWSLLVKSKYDIRVIEIDKTTLLGIEKFKLYANPLIRCGLKLSLSTLGLPAIKSLYIEYNPENELTSLSGFSNLEYLTIKNLKLNKSSLHGLDRLKKLKLYECNLNEFDSESLRLPNLILLEINKVLIPLDLKYLTRLEWLSLEHVKNLDMIQNLCDENLICLDIFCSKITLEAANKFLGEEKFPHLIKLSLSDNCLRDLNKEWLSKWFNLKHLCLDSNYIDNLDFLECESLSNLEYLDLSSNYLTLIKPDAFVHTLKLRVLDLSYNAISIEQDLFSHLKQLKTLSLRKWHGMIRPCISKEVHEYFIKSNVELVDLS